MLFSKHQETVNIYTGKVAGNESMDMPADAKDTESIAARDRLPNNFDLSVFAPPEKGNSQSPQLPHLEISKIDSCILNFNQKLSSALSDNWAIYPGLTGLTFGATSGSLAKHLALSPAANPAMRQFKVVRAGLIWGLAGFAANYLGGAIASYASSDSKEELCRRSLEIDFLKKAFQRQQS